MQINALIKVPILPDPLPGCVESAHETTSHYPSKQDGTLHVQVGILNSAKQFWSPVVRRALQKDLQFPPGLLKMLYMYIGWLLLPQLHHRIQVAAGQFGVVVLLLYSNGDIWVVLWVYRLKYHTWSYWRLQPWSNHSWLVRLVSDVRVLLVMVLWYVLLLRKVVHVHEVGGKSCDCHVTPGRPLATGSYALYSV